MNKYKTVSNPTPMYSNTSGKWKFACNLKEGVIIKAVMGYIYLDGHNQRAVLFATEKIKKAAILLKDVQIITNFSMSSSSGRNVKVVGYDDTVGGACRVKKTLGGFAGERESEPTLERDAFYNLSKNGGLGGLNAVPVPSNVVIANLPINIIHEAMLSPIQTPPPPRPYVSETSETPADTPAPLPDAAAIAAALANAGGGGAGGGGAAPAEEAATTPAPAKIPFYKNKYFIGGSAVVVITAIFFGVRQYYKNKNKK